LHIRRGALHSTRPYLRHRFSHSAICWGFTGAHRIERLVENEFLRVREWVDRQALRRHFLPSGPREPLVLADEDGFTDVTLRSEAVADATDLFGGEAKTLAEVGVEDCANRRGFGFESTGFTCADCGLGLLRAGAPREYFGSSMLLMSVSVRRAGALRPSQE
jgi:hypothetical protein